MFKDRPDVIKLAKEFVEICEKENIWYTADNGSLLGAVREKGMIPWDDDFDVMMTPESYKELKEMFPERVIDTDTNGYPLLIPKFMKTKKEYLNSAVFVDIFVVVPTNIKNVKKYRNLINKTRFAMQTIHSDWIPFNFGSKLFKIISWPFKKIPKKLTIDWAINLLKVDEENADGYFTIDNPIDPLKINWQKALSRKTEKAKFENFLVDIPVEYNDILIQKYGKDYKTPNKNARSIEHINAISITKVKRK
ncbi:MAG: LicD family protein [Mycoplasmatales bacterium]|nr:LicD family protein [Mycoplasmatales bacterium]